MDPYERFNKLVPILRGLRKPGEETMFRFFVGPEQEASLRLQATDLEAYHYGLIKSEQVPQSGLYANQRGIQFSSGTFATTSVELAAALTFEKKITPSPTWYGPAVAMLPPEPKPAPPPEPEPEPETVDDFEPEPEPPKADVATHGRLADTVNRLPQAPAKNRKRR